ncbi:MAG: hypothetical protein KDB22_20505 [Planctomycetales bacterium]|nr:hypothetical protein [Planctomycetales bacterium]
MTVLPGLERRPGETGFVVDRLRPGRQCVESEDDVRAVAVFMEAIEQAQSLDRHGGRERAASVQSPTVLTSPTIVVASPARVLENDCRVR